MLGLSHGSMKIHCLLYSRLPSITGELYGHIAEAGVAGVSVIVPVTVSAAVAVVACATIIIVVAAAFYYKRKSAMAKKGTYI